MLPGIRAPEVVRELVARLPEALEGAHHGHPDFRVRKKIFATLWPANNRSVLRLTCVEARTLASQQPDTYRLVSDREPFGWLSVQLERVEIEAFGDLLEEAWRLRAPADLIAAYDLSC